MPQFSIEEEEEFYNYTKTVDDEAVQLLSYLNAINKEIYGEIIKDNAYRIRNKHLDFKISLVNLRLTNNIKIVNKKTDDVVIQYNKALLDVQNKINELVKKINEFDKLKSSLFEFSGIIIGLLGFIFVNFQLITTATSLSLGKMIIYLGLDNIALITGIIIILDVLSVILDRKKKIGLIKLITTRKKTIFSLVSLILLVGIGVYHYIDKPENYQVIKRIEILENINKIQDENKELREKLNKKEIEMAILLNEINNLKSNKNEK